MYVGGGGRVPGGLIVGIVVAVLTASLCVGVMIGRAMSRGNEAGRIETEEAGRSGDSTDLIDQDSPTTLRVSFNTQGNIVVRSGSDVLTPLEISTPPPSEFRGPFAYYRDELYPDERLLIVHLATKQPNAEQALDEQFVVYGLGQDEDLASGMPRISVTYRAEGSVYQQNDLRDEEDGDIILELVRTPPLLPPPALASPETQPGAPSP